ncbi:MAG: hypothetical protein AAFX09_01835 [Pseudomonadota bacterium]
MSYLRRWTETDQKNFRKDIVLGEHALADTGLFCDEALAGLLERRPRDLSDFCTMDETGSRGSWHGGDPGKRCGHELLEEVRSGRLWVNLREVFNDEPEYAHLMNTVMGELKALHPDFKPQKLMGGLLISSPNARVPFHIDRTDTMLWHLRGSKRVFVYPRVEPVLRECDVEEILMHPDNDDLPYEASFDDHAHTFDLKPGEVICWPVHSPHKVVNLDGLNVSMTTEYATTDVRVRNNAMVFNGLLRRRFGMSPEIDTAGPLHMGAKAGLGLAARKLKLLPKLPDPHAPEGEVFNPA